MFLFGGGGVVVAGGGGGGLGGLELFHGKGSYSYG